MLSTVTVVLPIFAIIVAGFLSRKAGFLGPNAWLDLNRYVVYLALPSLLFRVVATADWSDLELMGMVAVFSLSSALIYGLTVGLCVLRKSSVANAGIDALGVAYSNTGYIGLPLCLLVLGKESLAAVALAGVVTIVVLFALAIIVVEAGLQERSSIRAIVRSVAVSLFRNPLVVAPAVAGIWAVSGFALPASVDTFLDLVGSSAGPCALVSLGLFFADAKKESSEGIWSKALLLSSAKLLLHPALTWALAVIFGLSPLLAGIAVLLAALPTGTGAFMLAELYRRETLTSSSVVMVSTILSLATLAMLLYWGGYAELALAAR